MSDIHGCYDDMMQMLKLVDFFEEDTLILAGDVYMFYDEEIDCTFYDIDCGCTSRGRIDNAKLACIRLNDEKIFYV